MSLFRFSFLLIGLGFTFSCSAEPFGNDLGSSWANTPQGKFECRNDKSTEYLQILKLNNRVIFKEARSPDPIREGATLSSGIEQMNTGCPAVLANNNGFVVLLRDTQPPSFGLQGYLIVNFNKPVPTMTVLGEGQRPEDDKIPNGKKFTWEDGVLKLRYFGYSIAKPGGSANSPKPGFHEVAFDLKTESARQLK